MQNINLYEKSKLWQLMKSSGGRVKRNKRWNKKKKTQDKDQLLNQVMEIFLCSGDKNKVANFQFNQFS